VSADSLLTVGTGNPHGCWQLWSGAE